MNVQALDDQVQSSFVVSRNGDSSINHHSFDIAVRDLSSSFNKDLAPRTDYCCVTNIETASLVRGQTCVTMNVVALKTDGDA